MYRWGDRESHSYVIGVFTKKQKALDEGEKEEEWRGGKYSAEVLEFSPNESLAGNHKKVKTVKEAIPHWAFTTRASTLSYYLNKAKEDGKRKKD
jgi:hypothetical protein